MNQPRRSDLPPSILIVDDDDAQRTLLRDVLQGQNYLITEASSAEAALETISERQPDLVLLDVHLPGMNGIDAIGEIRRVALDLPVLMITAFADLRQAVTAIKLGASDYLSKPVDLDELRAVIADLLGRQASQSRADQNTRPLPNGIVVASPAMASVLETVAVVAPSNASVLVLGESGSGKEVVAQLLHQWSPRASFPFVAANCAGLPESLIESQLFGHARGAFTGAHGQQQGFFRAAHQGTLFLDEIGELPLHLQPKLLRALEAKEVTPLGSDTAVPVDVRVITATNRDLGEEVRAGRFREDLFYRLAVIEVTVPRLQDRAEDILPLARRFAVEFSGAPVRLSPQAMHCLTAYAWPGNVRELRNAIQRACLLCRGDLILPEHLPPKIAAGSAIGESDTTERGRLSQAERATIAATLEECQGNRTRAAEKLGISRRTLIYKLKALGLSHL